MAHAGHNVRVIRAPRPSEVEAWRRWYPRRDVRQMIGRYCRWGGYIALPGGRDQAVASPPTSTAPSPGGGGHAA